MTPSKWVCVYCSSSETIDPLHIDLAAEVGRRIAAAGYGLVSGGGRVSMMGAVARAARQAGAPTVGVIPARLIAFEVGDTDADELIVVDTMRERKKIMDDRSDAFIALPGGIGTLEELFEVWTAHTLDMHPKPVIVLDPSGFYAPLWVFLDSLCASGFVRRRALDLLHRVDSVDAAFALLAEL